ncbi:exported hypothetical protein [Candidatus Zixiibacteriota bacterium]|nr:exported hypothetical protein [candidate division Zixibacteria bacterium]
MANLKMTVSVLFSLVFIVALANFVAAQTPKGTIITTDGTRFESVNFTVNSVYKVITINQDGKKTNVSFDRISQILDEEGRDITASVLEGYSDKQMETWETENQVRQKYATPKPWSVVFRLGGNFTIPIGRYYEGIKSGPGFEGNILIQLTDNVALRGAVAISPLDLEEGYGFYSLDPDVVIIGQDNNFTIGKYAIGVQYNSRNIARVAGKGFFFAHSGLGVIQHKFSTDMTYISGGETYTEKKSTSSSKFMTNFGTGGAVFLSRSLALDAGIDLALTFTSSDEYRDAYVFDLKVGLMILL